MTLIMWIVRLGQLLTSVRLVGEYMTNFGLGLRNLCWMRVDGCDCFLEMSWELILVLSVMGCFVGGSSRLWGVTVVHWSLLTLPFLGSGVFFLSPISGVSSSSFWRIRGPEPRADFAWNDG